ncbi:MAG: LysR family transcriptional regulator [Sandaracinaceae bacterium]
MKDPLETAALAAFVRIVDAESISKAAAELGVPRATVGRRLSDLESRLGVRLIRRTTRSLALTDAGETLYRHARIALDAVAAAEGSVARPSGAIEGDVRVSVPPLLSPSFARLVADLAAKHPQVRLHVHFSTELVDLQRGGFDVALRATSSALPPGLVAKTLSRARAVAMASPAYLEAHGVPRTRRDLARHRLIIDFERGERPRAHWPLVSGKSVRVEGAFYSNDLRMLLAAAVRGIGIALLPEAWSQPLVETGELVPVLEGVVGTETRIAIVYAERELMSPAVRALIDAVTEWAPDQLPPDPFREIEECNAEQAVRRAQRRRRAGAK